MKKLLLFLFAILTIATNVKAGQEVLPVNSATFWGVNAPATSGSGTYLVSATVPTKSVTSGVVTITTNKGDAGTASCVWNNVDVFTFRTYNKSTLQIESDSTITSIVIEGVKNKMPLTYSGTDGTLATTEDTKLTWTGSATNVVISATGTCQINSITVTYGSGNATGLSYTLTECRKFTNIPTKLDSRQSTLLDGKLYIKVKGVEPQIMVYDATGILDTIIAAPDANTTNICHDDAGNIIYRQSGAFPNVPGSTEADVLTVITPNGERRTVTLPLAGAGIPATRLDFYSDVVGNILEGEAYFFYPENGTSNLYIVTFNNGVVNPAKCGMVALDGAYCNDATKIYPFGKGKFILHYRGANPVLYTYAYNGSNWDVVKVGNINCPGRFNSNGITTFKLDTVDYIAYPSGTGYFDGFSVAKLTTDGSEIEPVAVWEQTTTSQTAGFQTCWLYAEVVDDNSAVIYQYFPGGWVKAFRFTASQTTPGEFPAQIYMAGSYNSWNYASCTTLAQDTELKGLYSTAADIAFNNNDTFAISEANGEEGAFNAAKWGAASDTTIVDQQPLPIAKDGENISIVSGNHTIVVDLLTHRVYGAGNLPYKKEDTTTNPSDTTANVTTNVDIDFNNAISGGKVVGKKGEMMIPTVDPAFELGYNGDSIGVLRVGNGAATVAIADAELAQAGQIVTISFDIWFGNLTTKYAGIDLLDAVGDTIAGFSYSAYNRAFSYDRFGMDVSKLKGTGGGAIADEKICVPSNKTTFTITLDYGTNKMKIVHEYNGTVQQTIEDVTMSNTNPLKTFVLQSNYSSFGSMRRCWFDNLKITTMTPAHQHTLTLVSDTVPATDEIAGHLAYWQCTGTEEDPGCMLYFADSLGTDTIGDATALAAWLAGEGMMPIAYNKEDRYVVVTTNDTMLVANTKYLSEVTNVTDSVNSLLLIFREGTESVHAGDTIAITEADLQSVEMKKGEELMPAATTGTAKRTGDIDVTWFQLWEDGPKFAEYNVGAENNKAEDYGGYYAWGGHQDKVDDHKSGSDTLSGDDDTATNLWGENWRMPTREEFWALLANCDVEWTVVNGVNGRKCTGKGDYASNSVFLPATGWCYDNYVGDLGRQGFYWSSTPDESNDAASLDFRSDYMNVDSYGRDYSFSVRAVLVEE